MTKDPEVSVIVPTRGRAGMIEQALRSLESQSLQNWEAVVVVDSDERTAVEAMQARASATSVASRVTVVGRTPGHAGASACRNTGWHLSTAPFLVFLDDDDLLAPDCLRTRTSVLRDRSDLDMIVSQSRMFSETPGDYDMFWNQFTAESDLDRFMRGDPVWQTAGPLWRRSFLTRLEGWDEAAGSWQDWEFHVRALAAECRYGRLRDSDCWYRRTRPGAISAGALDPAQIANRFHTIARVVQHLARDRKLTSARRQAIRGRCMQYVLTLSQAQPPMLPAAFDLAQTGAALGLVDRWVVAVLWILRRASVAPSSLLGRALNRLLRDLLAPSAGAPIPSHLRAQQIWWPREISGDMLETGQQIAFDVEPR